MELFLVTYEHFLDFYELFDDFEGWEYDLYDKVE